MSMYTLEREPTPTPTDLAIRTGRYIHDHGLAERLHTIPSLSGRSKLLVHNIRTPFNQDVRLWVDHQHRRVQEDSLEVVHRNIIIDKERRAWQIQHQLNLEEEDGLETSEDGLYEDLFVMSNLCYVFAYNHMQGFRREDFMDTMSEPEVELVMHDMGEVILRNLPD